MALEEDPIGVQQVLPLFSPPPDATRVEALVGWTRPRTFGSRDCEREGVACNAADRALVPQQSSSTRLYSMQTPADGGAQRTHSL